MNLKESFRYQKHLDNLMFMAQQSITNKMHALKITKNHLRSKANSEATDEVEIVDAGDFHANDDVLKFMKYLITQKEALSTAISKAKASLAIDIDAATETNKYRQNLKSSIASMLRYTASKKEETETGRKFNVEGNQTTYYYPVEVITEEAYDRNNAKSIMKEVITKADVVSNEIDAALINTVIDYIAPFDVNDSFDDAIEIFLAL